MRIGHELFATPPRGRTVPHHTGHMDRPPAHRPPPAAVVTALVRAGVSFSTAMAMERWKAQEVLDLLGGGHPASGNRDEGMARPA
jgi:hypothetical protein